MRASQALFGIKRDPEATKSGSMSSSGVVIRLSCLVGGVIVTLFLAPWGIAFTLGPVFAGHTDHFADGLGMLIWGLAAMLGVVAFWHWFFSKPPLPEWRRVVTTIGLLLGCAAVFPLIAFPNLPMFAVPAGIGMLTACVAICDMWITGRNARKQGIPKQ